jgi:hypothetical protein
MGSVGENWEVFVKETGQWRPAKIINESGDQAGTPLKVSPRFVDGL